MWPRKAGSLLRGIDTWFVAYLGLLGAVVGSFLHVVSWRLPRRQSIVRPPSACPSCAHRLTAADLVPILSWLLLRGRCRYCRAAISVRYPLVELLTGACFALVALGCGITWRVWLPLGLVVVWIPCALIAHDKADQARVRRGNPRRAPRQLWLWRLTAAGCWMALVATIVAVWLPRWRQ